MGLLSGSKKQKKVITTTTATSAGQGLADRGGVAVSGLTVTEQGSLSLTLSDQGTVARSFDLADKAFGSVEDIYKDSAERVSAATSEVANAYAKGRELEGAVNADNLLRWLVGAAVILGGGYFYARRGGR